MVLKNTVGNSDGLLALLLEQDLLDVGKDAPGSNGDPAKQLVQLLVIANGKLRSEIVTKRNWKIIISQNLRGANYREVSRGDALLLVVPGSVSGKLQQLSGEVLQDGSQVHPGTLPDASGEATLLDEPSVAGNGDVSPAFARLEPAASAGFKVQALWS